MKFEFLHDRDEIEQYLRSNTFLHIYGIGDLDDFFWPHTCWFGSRSAGKVNCAALLYSGLELPTLILMSEDVSPESEFLSSIAHMLPDPVFCHLSTGLATALESTHDLQPHGKFNRMALLSSDSLYKVDCGDVIQLKESDLPELLEFYRWSYPANWFDPRMLQTGKYYCIRKDGDIVCAGGIHVYSPVYRIGTLGNIATHTDFRGRGLATSVTAKVCLSMIDSVEHIGLNVKKDNSAAISCYENLGFRTVSSFGEFYARRRGGETLK